MKYCTWRNETFLNFYTPNLWSYIYTIQNICFWVHEGIFKRKRLIHPLCKWHFAKYLFLVPSFSHSRYVLLERIYGCFQFPNTETTDLNIRCYQLWFFSQWIALRFLRGSVVYCILCFSLPPGLTNSSSPNASSIKDPWLGSFVLKKLILVSRM